MTDFIFYCRKRIPFRQNMPCHRTMTTPMILQMPGKSQIYTLPKILFIFFKIYMSPYSKFYRRLLEDTGAEEESPVHVEQIVQNMRQREIEM